jgi:hypothetical protein
LTLQIKTTGVEDYIDGSANIKMLIIGGPSAGKTRSASFWPKPIYADTESGRASIADRNVAYAEIKSSKDMLDFLEHLKALERTPKGSRQFQTVIIDTLDGFQRKVKDEWLQQNKGKGSFTGYDAWGYLDSKMQMLMTRLLNLDYNVIVNCHFKEKTTKKGEDETTELMLQLQGDLKDSAINDFDLVGWMGTYWAPENGERVEKRGLTFKKTPDKWFLKDRFHAMPSWVPITFTDDDYAFVLSAFLSKVDDLTAGGVVGEIHSAPDENTIPTTGVVAPTAGPLPPQDPKEVPLTQLDKTTLMRRARDLGIKNTADGQPIKGNTTKGELVAAIEAHQQAEKTDTPAASGETAPAPESPAPSQPAPEPAPKPAPEKAAPTPEPAAEQATPVTEDGLKPGESVNTETGEVTEEQAVKNVQEGLGGEVVSSEPVAETSQAPAPEPAKSDDPWVTPPAAAPTERVCEHVGCGKSLAGENQNYVKLSFIKFRKYFCNEHYLEAKKG